MGKSSFLSRSTPTLKAYFDQHSPTCRTPILALVEAFGLRGKSVLSVGAKVGHEEVWFYRSGCPLELCDIDEHGDVEPILQQLPEGDLVYHVGDAKELSKSYDCIYMSSFAPDELKIRAIHRRNTLMQPLHLIPYALAKMTGRERASTAKWRGDEPLSPITADLARRSDLILWQSYASGKPADDRDYLEQMRRQLGKKLMEVWYYQERPSFHLVAASDTTLSLKDIPCIHGRGTDRLSSKKLQRISFQ